MNYELKNVRATGGPVDNKDGVSRDMRIAISANVVGNTYPDFIPEKSGVVNFLKTDSQDQIEAKMTAVGQAYVTAHYPNT